ncbi:hypothetical protein SAMN06265379_101375 [Saccharicrinis carchari]|uniref:Uncharacterized protein n=1 Tax=Saccharicrinis carchari TaxID=1168039 RepID=A0A521ASW0_SACCC|nr:hypothetical protein [Saccharicrinis carchari]SMO37875.1 hypothetical protein SAMN06265379_101375 [Saccharicrinis carchari]
MLEHQKIVLEGVIDYPELFKKELIKSSNWLSAPEYKLLKKWVFEDFAYRHHAIIVEVFGTNTKEQDTWL